MTSDRRYATPTGDPCPRSVRCDGTLDGSGDCHGCGFCLLVLESAWPSASDAPAIAVSASSDGSRVMPGHSGPVNGTPRIEPSDPEAFFAGSRLGHAVYCRVRSIIGGRHDVEVRTTHSQVAFRHSRGFAFLWRPGQHLAAPTAEVVLSIALDRHDPSPRFKEVVQVPGQHWMHHLEIHQLAAVDDEVESWLREAEEAAAPSRSGRLQPVAPD